ncbi:MAG TPA: hypothetical protein P5556_08040 [Candidatus Gastranaerophilales bacterium]|nr:hypothetical protein [Candidatus Gastranaerophilales bacterium]
MIINSNQKQVSFGVQVKFDEALKKALKIESQMPPVSSEAVAEFRLLKNLYPDTEKGDKFINKFNDPNGNVALTVKLEDKLKGISLVPLKKFLEAPGKIGKQMYAKAIGQISEKQHIHKSGQAHNFGDGIATGGIPQKGVLNLGEATKQYAQGIANDFKKLEKKESILNTNSDWFLPRFNQIESKK